jgi:PST family polysaccharide transporter
VSTGDLRRRALRGGLTRLTAQAALFVLRVGSIMVLARLLEPADFGLVNMATVVTGFLGLFRDAGLPMVTVQRQTISDAEVSSLFWVNLLIGATLTAFSIAAAPLLAAFYHEPRLLWVAVAIGSGLLFGAVGVQHTAILQRRMRFTALVVVEVVANIAAVIVGVSLALRGFGYWALVGMLIALPIGSTVGAWICSGWRPQLPSRTVQLAPMIRFGGLLTLNGFVMYIAYNTDKLLLGRFAGAESLGLYGRAYQLVSVPTEILYQAVGGVAQSVLSRLQSDAQRMASYFLKGYAVFLAMAIPITAASGLFAGDIIQVLLGPKWSATAPILRALSPTVVAFAVLHPVGWLLYATGQVERSVKIAFAIAALLVVAFVAGLPFGPVGVAVAFSVGLTTMTVPVVMWGLRGSVVAPRRMAEAATPATVAALLAAAITLPLMAWLASPLPPLVRLLCEGSLFAASYVFCLFYPLRQRVFFAGLLQDLRTSL